MVMLLSVTSTKRSPGIVSLWTSTADTKGAVFASIAYTTPRASIASSALTATTDPATYHWIPQTSVNVRKLSRLFHYPWRIFFLLWKTIIKAFDEGLAQNVVKLWSQMIVIVFFSFNNGCVAFLINKILKPSNYTWYWILTWTVL